LNGFPGKAESASHPAPTPNVRLRSCL
jgi:hypothetical protein